MRGIEKIIRAGRVMEIQRLIAPRYGMRGRGGPPEKDSPESTKRAHIKRTEAKLRWKLNTNFEDGKDALVTLSWKKATAPENSEEMKKRFRNFLRRLKTRYKKCGKELKYVMTMEVGPKGSRHIHMVLSNADLKELRECWESGQIVNVVPLNSGGQYADIASYFVKYGLKTQETEGRKVGQLYTPSRNLKEPQITVRVISRKCGFRDPKERKGYMLDKDHTTYGEYSDGTPYQEIAYIRLKEPERKRTKHRRRLRP